MDIIHRYVLTLVLCAGMRRAGTQTQGDTDTQDDQPASIEEGDNSREETTGNDSMPDYDLIIIEEIM